MTIQPKTKSVGRDYPLAPTPIPPSPAMAMPIAAANKTTGRGIVNVPMAGRAIVNKGQI